MRNTEEELLIILMEECAEVIQQASKIIRFGKTPPTKKEKSLAKELGDLLCMIILLEEYGTVSKNAVTENCLAKREKLKEWSNLPLELLDSDDRSI